MRAAEQWTRMQGCIEMASDTWIDDERSQRAWSMRFRDVSPRPW